MKRIVLCAAVLLSLAAPLAALEIEVEEMLFCAAIEDRVPVQADSIFSDTVQSVFCYTRITGVADTTSIFHVWYHEDAEKARVELEIRSSDWRTWSSKKILESWTGIWRVDVILPDGKLLRSNEFLVKPSEKPE